MPEELAEDLNEVLLRGRVSSAPVERELPSGTSILSFRVAVGRSKTAMTAGSRQTSDWVDCAAWGARAKKSVQSWGVGDRVEVHGSFRRRFIRAESGVASSRVEVEVLRGRMVTRAG